MTPIGVRMACSSVRALVGDLRDAACADAGSRQARRRTRPAGAPAPACGTASDCAGLGDPSAARARRVGAIVAALDLRHHEATIEHSDGRVERVPLAPNRSVGEVTARCWPLCASLGGPVEINLDPQETTWTTPLDEDEEHATYDPGRSPRTSRPRRRRRSSSRRSARRTEAARPRSTPGGARSTSL